MPNNQENSTQNNKTTSKAIDFIKSNKWYLILVASMLIPYIYQFHGGLSADSEKWDHFGSYIGGVFSAITLLSVLHGMQVERRRFDEQKAEFEQDKKEQEERKKKEDFEKTFFMMLEQHNINLRELENRSNKENSLIDKTYKVVLSNKTFSEIRFELDHNIALDYSKLETYFLNLYRILKFIYKNKELNIDNEYSSLLRSFISKETLTILAYHLCERTEQYKSYITYVNELSLLEHLNLDELEFSFLSYLTSIDKMELYQHFLSHPTDLHFSKWKKLNNDYQNLDKYYTENFPIHDGVDEESKNEFEYWSRDNNNQRLLDEFNNEALELERLLHKEELIDVKVSKIFRKKKNIKEILKEDYIPSNKEKDDLKLYYTEEKLLDDFEIKIEKKYYKINPLENEEKLKNVFFYILKTFSEKAFSTEQETKFKNLKTIYNLFIKELK